MPTYAIHQGRLYRSDNIGPAYNQETQPFLSTATGNSAIENMVSAVSGSKTNPHVPPSTFEHDFYKIQLAAARLVSIQEKAKRKGSLSAEDNKVYAESLIELGQAAQSLAKLQQSGQIQDFSLLFQPINGLMPQKQPPHLAASVESSISQDTTTVGEQKVDEATEQQISEDQLIPLSPDDPYEDINDSVVISTPKKDASVAEAKPIGLSIAGEGGVASSKPNAVALSGRNGLAISAPKATAIAGVSPEEAAAFSIPLPSRNHIILKSTRTTTTKKPSTQRMSSVPIGQQLPYDEFDYVDLKATKSFPSGVPYPSDSTSRLRTKTAAGIARLIQPKAIGGSVRSNKWVDERNPNIQMTFELND